jgi:hypothetical protein
LRLTFRERQKPGAEGEGEMMKFNPFLIKSEGWRRFSIAAGFAALVAWIIFIAVTVYDTYTAPRSGFTPIGATPVHLDKALEIILVGLAFIILAYIAIMIVLHVTLWVVRGFRNFKN